MKVTVEGNLPKSFGLTKTRLKAASAYFAGRSSSRSGLVFGEIAVILQKDAESADVHLAINGAEGATDVVTQPYDPMPGEPEGVCGELYVNTDQALREAPIRRGWSVAKELLLYVAHGMDHLSGADDLEPEDYRRMRRRELGWIADFERQ